MVIKPPELKLLKRGWLPNLRQLIIPDPGCTLIDMDLDRADLQVVVWEAADKELREALRLGLDMHLFNAASIFNLAIPADECSEAHPNYKNWKDQYYPQRQKAKIGVHATNYGAGLKRLAEALGITVQDADLFRKAWFARHPGIKAWHRRTNQQLAIDKTITNKFGYRIVFFDRADNLMNQALAWLPQSTVAIVIDMAMDNIDRNLRKEVDIKLQVHDSLVLQCPTSEVHNVIPLIRQQSLITIPYDDPLVIPVGFKTSTKSWGHCDNYTAKGKPSDYQEKAA